ncbi:MAG: hypothetical protein ABJC87_17935 [Roseobacter sp.]
MRFVRQKIGSFENREKPAMNAWHRAGQVRDFMRAGMSEHPACPSQLWARTGACR